MRYIILLLLWAIAMPALSTKYYIDSSNGSDSNNGTSTSAAWKNLSKVNSTSFSPGDSILLKRGGVWRETLTLNSSGTSTGYIGFGSYGTGANPQILGSKNSTWTNNGGNIWISDQTCTNPYGGGFTSEIFFVNPDGTVSRGAHKTSTASLTTDLSWTWVTNKVYIYSATDPDTRYSSVEIPQRGTIIEPNNKNYIGFRNIDLLFSASEGLGDGSYPNQNCRGLIIENAEIAYHGSMVAEIGYGTTAVYSDMIIRNCKIHDCGRRSISLDPYASGFTISNILVEGNELYNGAHTTGIDMSIGSGNFNVSLDNIVIRGNLIFDDPYSTLTSELLFAQNYNAGGTFTNLYIYNNIFMNPTLSAVHLEKVQSAYIYNNTFYNHSKVMSGNTFHVFVDAGSTNVKIKNNIFYTDKASDSGVTGLAIYESPSQDHNQIEANNNLFYRTGTGLKIVLANNVNYTMSNFSSLKSQIGWEANSPIPQNPMFLTSSDLHLQSGSPAIGAGVPLSQIIADFDGTARSNPPEIGCYEYGITQVVTPVYVSSVIENASPALLEMTYNTSLANIVPAASAFTVMVNSVARSVTSVAISGTKVRLTLSASVANGNIVTVAYAKPASNPVQTASGGQAVSITAQSVTNNVQAAVTLPVYVSSVISNSTPGIIEMTYNLSLANIVPSASAFTVIVNSASRSVTAVAVTGTKVQLTLSSAVANGNVVTVAYNKPATNPVQTPAGGQAASLTAQPVTNNVLATVPLPVYVSSVIENASPALLEMTYNLSLANIVPSASAFTVIVNSASRSVTAVAVSGTKVQLTLSSAVAYGNIVTVAYNKPASNQLQTPAGGQASSFTAQSVTNNVQAIIGNPVYISSVIENATPDVIEMTYDISLANVVPAVTSFGVMVNYASMNCISAAISNGKVRLTLASALDFDDIITLSYTKPGTNPLQTPTGGLADNLTSQQVTNNIEDDQTTIIKKVPRNYKITIYPNPAKSYFNIAFEESDFNPQIIRIINSAGSVMSETSISSSGVNTVQIPISLRSGIYFVQVIGEGGIVLATRKLLVRT